jgi:hypothetical protein
MIRSHSALARDAALRRLRSVNRWLIAGSVALTGVLTEVAAQAFPGKTLGRSSTNSHRRARSSGKSGAAGSSSRPLAPPSEAPEASSSDPSTGDSPSSPEAPGEGAPAQEASPSGQAPGASEGAPAGEASPSQETAAPTEAPPARESPEAVVSGGS